MARGYGGSMKKSKRMASAKGVVGGRGNRGKGAGMRRGMRR